jgi:hypothetical protein
MFKGLLKPGAFKLWVNCIQLVTAPHPGSSGSSSAPPSSGPRCSHWTATRSSDHEETTRRKQRETFFDRKQRFAKKKKKTKLGLRSTQVANYDADAAHTGVGVGMHVATGRGDVHLCYGPPGVADPHRGVGGAAGVEHSLVHRARGELLVWANSEEAAGGFFFFSVSLSLSLEGERKCAENDGGVAHSSFRTDNTALAPSPTPPPTPLTARVAWRRRRLQRRRLSSERAERFIGESDPDPQLFLFKFFFFLFDFFAVFVFLTEFLPHTHAPALPPGTPAAPATRTPGAHAPARGRQPW